MIHILTGKTPHRLFEREDTYSLKGICLLMIIIHHIYKIWVSDYNYEVNQIINYWGDLGSGVFFLLSGYGLFCSLSNTKDFAKYALKCLKKLFAPYCVVWGLFIFFSFFHRRL